jgi:hypothetical protein
VYYRVLQALSGDSDQLIHECITARQQMLCYKIKKFWEEGVTARLTSEAYIFTEVYRSYKSVTVHLGDVFIC